MAPGMPQQVLPVRCERLGAAPFCRDQRRSEEVGAMKSEAIGLGGRACDGHVAVFVNVVLELELEGVLCREECRHPAEDGFRLLALLC